MGKTPLSTKQRAQDTEDSLSDQESPSSSNMVSVRMDMAVRLQLDALGDKHHLKRSDIARAYLNLSQTVVVKTNQKIYLTDDTEVGFIPLNFLGDVFAAITDVKQIDLGDKLGTLARQNCAMKAFQTWQEKIAYVCSLGWFDIRKINQQDEKGKWWIYHAIFTSDMPLNMLHALLYRLLDGTKYPSALSVDEFLKDNFRRLKRKNPDGNWKNFVEKLGGHEENFQEDNMIFKFEALKEELTD